MTSFEKMGKGCLRKSKMGCSANPAPTKNVFTLQQVKIQKPTNTNTSTTMFKANTG